MVGELQALARARQVHFEDPADGGRGPVGHHHDAIGEQHRLVDVVRDHHHRAAGARDDAHQLVLQVRAGERVERAERLVEQQHLGLHRQRARDAHALLHAAGDLLGILRGRVRRGRTSASALRVRSCELRLRLAAAEDALDREVHVARRR